MRLLWRWILAYFRLDMEAVCVMSKGCVDYHDYDDDIVGEPWHFTDLKCKRCGKEFQI